MTLTDMQAYVLANIDRVTPGHSSIKARSAMKRFELDGWNCTLQVNLLCSKGLIKPTTDGWYACRSGVVAASPTVTPFPLT